MLSNKIRHIRAKDLAIYIYNQVEYSSGSSLSDDSILDSVKIKFVFQSSTRSVDFLIVSGSVSIKRRVCSSVELLVGVMFWFSSSSSSFSISKKKKINS